MKKLLILLFLALLVHAKSTHYQLYKKGDSTTGNTLMIFGGIHGNETGGYYAPALLAQYYTITHGALWVIPNLNKKSISHFVRGINGDMNRKFATISKNDKDYDTVKEVKSLINHKEVDLILNLHDGHGFYRKQYKDKTYNPRAWGQSCVIDQIDIDDNSSNFAQLKKIANKVSDILNEGLLKEHHYFHVKNTKTRFKNFAMQQSLTYYAIKHKKPAFAIETSKSITKTSDKVLYQLRAIEAFMKIMNINYTRSFTLDKKGVENQLLKLGTVTINNNIRFNLRDAKRILRYIPMKAKNNDIKLSHPLADVIKQQKYYELFIGEKRIVSLFPQIFKMDNSLKNLMIKLDGIKQSVPIPSTLDINDNFTILAPKGYRVNIIGYTNPKHVNENNITLSYKHMIPKYAIDRGRRRFRAEIYKDDSFCGMIILNFLPQD